MISAIEKQLSELGWWACKNCSIGESKHYHPHDQTTCPRTGQKREECELKES